MGESLRVAGLFAGIGGIELGLHKAGHRTELLCEIDPAAQRILAKWFSGVPLVDDVRTLRSIPRVDVLTAGFPCQDLSQAGRTAGIGGRNSGLVEHVFELIVESLGPQWLLLENVPFMLQLDRGKAMHYLTSSLEDLGFTWAYRVVDTRAFGLPHRRRRVIMVASRTDDPCDVLFPDDRGEPQWPDQDTVACGFYWTEGIRGLGWAVDAVPTLKGGSTLGIPSPPAIRFTDGLIATPDIRDAERLQGFVADWTSPGSGPARPRSGHRWKLVGNAVSVPVFEWVGKRLTTPGSYTGGGDEVLQAGDPWPMAAWGGDGKTRKAAVSAWPVARTRPHLAEFLQFPPASLSLKATSGFFGRMARSSLRFPPGFREVVARHLEKMGD